jgi:hypothetical protein
MVPFFKRWYRLHKLKYKKHLLSRERTPYEMFLHLERVIHDMDFTSLPASSGAELTLTCNLPNAINLLTSLEEIAYSLRTHKTVTYNRRYYNSTASPYSVTQWLWRAIYLKRYDINSYKDRITVLTRNIVDELAVLYPRQPRYVNGHLRDVTEALTATVELFIELEMILENTHGTV